MSESATPATINPADHTGNAVASLSLFISEEAHRKPFSLNILTPNPADPLEKPVQHNMTGVIRPEVIISGGQEITIKGLPAVTAQAADGTSIERLLNYHKECFLFGYHGINEAKALPTKSRGPEFSLCMAYFFRPNQDKEQSITFNISYASGNAPAMYSRLRPRDLEPKANSARIKELREQLAKEAFCYIHGADTFVFRNTLAETERSIVINYCLKYIRDSLQTYLDFVYQEAMNHNTLPNYWDNRLELPSKEKLKAGSPLWKPERSAYRTKAPEPDYRLLLKVQAPKNVTPPQ